jgi:hypothetical protein
LGEEGIEHLDDGLALGRRELLDLAEAAPEPCVLSASVRLRRRHAEQLIGRHRERLGEHRQQVRWRVLRLAFVVGYHALGDP